MEPTYELFDHTADLGLRVRAGSMPELLGPAAQGLYAAIGDLMPGSEGEHQNVCLTGGTPAQLLRDFLAELLLRFERRGQMMISVERPHLDDPSLRATLEYRLVDEARSVYHREVKAITYHELAIRSIPGGYEATIIVDI